MIIKVVLVVLVNVVQRHTNALSLGHLSSRVTQVFLSLSLSLSVALAQCTSLVENRH